MIAIRSGTELQKFFKKVQILFGRLKKGITFAAANKETSWQNVQRNSVKRAFKKNLNFYLVIKKKVLHLHPL